MNVRQTIGSLLLAAGMTCSGAANAALSFLTTGDMLQVSGKAEIGDLEKLTASLSPEIRTIVLLGPDGENWSLARDMSAQIESRKLTTVAQGSCSSFTCALMFLGGTTRMFSGAGRPETHYVMLNFWEANTGSSYGITADKTPMNEVLTWWSAHTKLSGSDLRVYHESIFSRIGGDFYYDRKVFFPDSAKVSPANVLHCAGEQEQKLKRRQTFPECMPVRNASALSKGIVTTNELFKHPNLSVANDIEAPAATTYAKLEDKLQLKLNDACQAQYELFLKQDAPRAFVVSANGVCAMRNALSPRPNYFALEACKRANNPGDCRFYAIDDKVVFTEFDQPAPTPVAATAPKAVKAPTATGAAAMPTPNLKPEHVSLALAKRYSKETGLVDITDQFTLEGKIVLFNTFRWEPADWAPGPQIMEVKWFINDKLIHTTRNSKINFQKSPANFWAAPITAELGTGNGRAELYANGELLGSKSFTISAN
jgi:hypothetical protein